MKLRAQILLTCFFTSWLVAEPLSNEKTIIYQLPPEAVDNFEARISELEQRVKYNEMLAGLNKVRFGLEFSTSYSNTFYEQYRNSIKAEADLSNKFAGDLHLNMDANINDYTRFYGRLSMARTWGKSSLTSLPSETSAGLDPTQSGSSSALYVSNAFVDLFFVKPDFYVRVGRQGGDDGFGATFRNGGLKQKQYYPAAISNSIIDALSVNFQPESLKDIDFALNGTYGKLYQNNYPYIGDDSAMWYLSLQSKLPFALSFMDDNKLLLSYTYLQDVTALALGDLSYLNMHFEAYDLFGVKLNYFASLTYAMGSNGKTVSDSSGNVYSFNEKNSYSAHIGWRYDMLSNFKIGAEYFYGSRFWYNLSTATTNDPLNIRQTRGHALDLYTIVPLDENQFLRLSYTKTYDLWTNKGTPYNGALGKRDLRVNKGGKGGRVDSADNIMLTYSVKF